MSVVGNFMKADRRCRNIFLNNMILKGISGFRKFGKRSMDGKMFPAFQFISVTNECNLRCQGCWVETGASGIYMDPGNIDSIVNAGKKQGSYFFGILGGEPLLHKDLNKVFEKHHDCYFQLFTNGTLLTRQVAQSLKKAGNVTPLVSFEGDEIVADQRRGGRNVYNRTIEAIKTATSSGLITGVAISVCKSNIDMALDDDFVKMLHNLGVLYLWYYIYRPAGTNPNYELALSADEILRLRKYLVDKRKKLPMVLIDSYWSADGVPFCPAADGLSHHINPSGDIEPCPVIQVAAENISDGRLDEVYEKSELLKAFREEIHVKTKGCVLMEDPAWIRNFAIEHDARNTSNRPGYLDQLASSPVVASHGSCPVIPEKSLIYRIAKKKAFFGLGAYG